METKTAFIFYIKLKPFSIQTFLLIYVNFFTCIQAFVYIYCLFYMSVDT